MDKNGTNLPGEEVTRKRRARFTQVALVLGTLTLFVNPVVVGRFLLLDPDERLYLLAVDAVLIVLLGLSIAYVRTSRERYRSAFFLAVLTVPFILIGSELTLSLWRLRHVDDWRHEEIRDVHEPHPTLGWRPIPNGRGRHVSEGNFDVVYEIDALARKAISTSFEDAPTLHFFADSYTFGHGVGNDDTALNVLAQGFARRHGFNVANYAVMGYGLEQMFTRLKLHQERIKPGDYVIFTPMSFDLLRNMIDKRFLCRYPVRKRTPLGEVMMRMDGRWQDIHLAEACNPTENRLLQSNFLFGLVYHAIRDRALHEQLTENADAIFAEARLLAESSGAEFVLVFLASPWECLKNKLDFDLSDLRSEHSSMLEHCPDLSMRFPTDSHWTPKGHRWVAGFLEEQLDLRSPAEAKVVAAP